MMMPILAMTAMVAVSGISTTFWLERDLHLYKFCSESKEHVLNHVVGTDAKNVLSNFGWQMSIPQMPCQAGELVRVFVSDFNNVLGRSLNLEPSTIFELEAIPISHGNRMGKIEQNILTLIPCEANTASMACVEIQGERPCSVFRWPMPGGLMNRGAMNGITVNGSVVRSHSHIQYMKYR
jgi:hypothetical protein